MVTVIRKRCGDYHRQVRFSKCRTWRYALEVTWAELPERLVNYIMLNPSTTDIDIPEGSFWVVWSSVRNRSVYAFSGVNGWPRKQLPDYGTYIWG